MRVVVSVSVVRLSRVVLRVRKAANVRVATRVANIDKSCGERKRAVGSVRLARRVVAAIRVVVVVSVGVVSRVTVAGSPPLASPPAASEACGAHRAGRYACISRVPLYNALDVYAFLCFWSRSGGCINPGAR